MPSFLDKAKQAWLRPRGLDSLLLFDWTGTILFILVGLTFTFFLFGYWWPYYRIADMDIWVVYNAFLLNDHLPQEYFDHPGYLTILSLANWFRLLHGVGLLNVHALSDLPPPADVAANEQAWTAAIRAGRLLSLGIAEALIVGFAMLLRRLVGDWRVAALGAFAFAFSGGLAMEARIMRTELISAGLSILALLILLIAAQRPSTSWRPALVGLAAFLMTLALLNKVQAIFLICAAPLIVMPFGCHGGDSGFWRIERFAVPAAACFVAAAILIAVPAAMLVWSGLASPDPYLHVVRWGGVPVYQPIIAAWIALGMIGFALRWRVSALETLAAMAAVLAGVALGLLFLDIRYNSANVSGVLNPLELMFRFAAASQNIALHDGMFGSSMIVALIRGFLSVLARLTFVLHTSPRPAIFLEWFVIAATIAALRAGQRTLALQVAVLMGAVWGIDTIGTLRGLKLEYFIYTDPLVIIAAALLLARFKSLQTHRWAFQIGTIFIAAHILVGMAEPAKHSMMRDVPVNYCGEHDSHTKRIDLLPFCSS